MLQPPPGERRYLVVTWSCISGPGIRDLVPFLHRRSKARCWPATTWQPMSSAAVSSRASPTSCPLWSSSPWEPRTVGIRGSTDKKLFWLSLHPSVVHLESYSRRCPHGELIAAAHGDTLCPSPEGLAIMPGKKMETGKRVYKEKNQFVFFTMMIFRGCKLLQVVEQKVMSSMLPAPLAAGKVVDSTVQPA